MSVFTHHTVCNRVTVMLSYLYSNNKLQPNVKNNSLEALVLLLYNVQ